MIQFLDVSHSYGERQVLRHISVDLSEHRIGIVGGNGSGKSTLARLCNGLIRPSEGRVKVHGHDTVTDLAFVRSNVGFVFQDPDLQIVMPTVAEDLAFSLRPLKLPRQELATRVNLWLSRYALNTHADLGAHLLSGGQKQLLAIAAILITEPQIVIFDEPTTLLDLKNKLKIMEVIDHLPQQIIVVTHDLDSLTDFDRVIVLDQGEVAYDGPPVPTLQAYRALVMAED